MTYIYFPIVIFFAYKILRYFFSAYQKTKLPIAEVLNWHYSEMEKYPQNHIEIIVSLIMEISEIHLKEDSKKFKGHDGKSIAELERNLNIKLPYGYSHFLEKIGASDLKIFDSQGYSINDVYYAQEVSNNILSNDNIALPTNAFVFSTWQGYSFYYFINNGTENPDTYLYIEKGDDEANTNPGTISYGSFTDWLLKLAIDSLELNKSFGFKTQERIIKLKKYL